MTKTREVKQAEKPPERTEVFGSKEDAATTVKADRLEGLPGNNSPADQWVSVPETDTGRWVEDTQARERTLVKELGNLTP